MDVYHIWCNLKDGVKDVEFADAVKRYVDHLKEQGQVLSINTRVALSQAGKLIRVGDQLRSS